MVTSNNYIESIKIDEYTPVKVSSFYKNFQEIEFRTFTKFPLKQHSEHTIVYTYNSAPTDIEDDETHHTVSLPNSVITDIGENTNDCGLIEYAYSFRINCEA